MEVLARDGRLFLPVALAAFALPGLLLGVSMPETPPGKLPPAGPWIAVAVIAILVSLTGQLSVLRLSMEPHVSVGEAISRSLRRLLPYIGAAILWLVPILIIGSALLGVLAMNQTQPSVPAAVALIALTIVGMFLAVRLMLSSPVASAEDVGSIAILRRSWMLSSGNWWRLFAFLLLFGIAALCLIWAIDSVAALLIRLVADDSGPRSLGGLLAAIVSQLVSASLSVVFFVMLARIYVQRSAQPSVPSSGT